MISEEQLDEYRVLGTNIRVCRDSDPANDVYGIVVAWDDKIVLIRKQSGRVVRLSRDYTFLPAEP
ncbi:MAG TPA: hypothetical protein VF260_05565 [Bacilli bacterium]